MITMDKFDQRLRWNHILIHRAIHDRIKAIINVGKKLPIKMNGRMRYASYEGFTLIEQNPNKTSVHAAKARAGEHITWGIPEDASKPWLYIDDDIAARFEAVLNERLKSANSAT